MEAEKALIGSLSLYPERISEVINIVNQDSFQDHRNGLIYAEMIKSYNNREPVDEVILRTNLDTKYPNESWAIILAESTICIGHSANASHYAKIVAEKYMARNLIQQAHEIISRIDHGEAPDTVGQATVKNIERYMQTGKDKTVSSQQIANREVVEFSPDIASGFSKLDTIHNGGVSATSFTVIGAGTSVGKTQLAINLMLKATKNNRPARVLYICQEMSDDELWDRMVCTVSGIPSRIAQRLRRRTADNQEVIEYQIEYDKAVSNLSNRQLFLHAEGPVTAEEVSSLVAKYHRDIDIVFIDYLQQVRRSHPSQTEFEKVSNISGECKLLPARYKIPIFGVSQINRQSDGKPKLANLRQSGQIEQDADNVWLLWRPKEENVDTEFMEVNVAKNRNGPLRTVSLKYQLTTGNITDY